MLAIGTIGGIIGIIASVIPMLVDGALHEAGSVFDVSGAGDTSTGIGLAALILSVFGIVGSSMAKTKPRAAAMLLLSCGVAGFVLMGKLWIVTGALFIIAGIMGLLSKPEAQSVGTEG